MANSKFHVFDKTITVETAKRNRSCKAICCSQRTIYPGEQHLAIYNADGTRNNYCVACAPAKIKNLEDQVNDATTAINAASEFLESYLS